MKHFARHIWLVSGLILTLSATACFRSAGGEIAPALDTTGAPVVAFVPTQTEAAPAVTAADLTAEATAPLIPIETPVEVPVIEKTAEVVVPTEMTPEVTPVVFDTLTETPTAAALPTETPLAEVTDVLVFPTETQPDLLTLITPSAVAFDALTATPEFTEVVALLPTLSPTPEFTEAALITATETLAFAPTETPTLFPTETATATSTETPTPTLTETPDPFALVTETPLGFVIAPTETSTPTPTIEVDLLILPSPTEAVSGLIVAQVASPTLSQSQIDATNILATATAGPLIATLTAQAALQPPQPTFTPTLEAGAIPFATATPPLAIVTPTPGIVSSGVDCVHQVVAGENLFRLSLRYGVSVNDIARASGITNINLIVVDDRLVIPGCGTTGVTPPPTVPAVAGDVLEGTPGGTGSTGGRVHVVQQYQTLFEISLLYGVSVNAIAAANGITNINLIYINQELIIP